MKRLIIVTLIVICGLTIGQFFLDKEEEASVLMLMSSTENAFFKEIADYARDLAEKKGMNLILMDSQNDAETEYNNFKKIKNIQVLVLNPTDGELSSKVVLEANARDIPVITMDRQVKKGYVTSHIGSDNMEGGRLGARYLRRIIGPEDVILVLEGIKDTSANAQRMAGFFEAAEFHKIQVDLVRGANFNRKDAYDLVKEEGLLDWATAVFATNDEMALGVLDLCIEEKKYVKIVGFDGSREALEAIESGYMNGTVAQQTFLIADKCMEAVEKVINGESVETISLVDLKMITNNE